MWVRLNFSAAIEAARNILMTLGASMLLLGCGGGEATKCEQSITVASDCGADTSTFTCDEEPTAMQNCIYDAYLVSTCDDLSTPGSVFFTEIESCFQKYES